MNQEPPHYRAYLLRLWQSESEGRQVWRASLEKPGASERQGFACIQDLVDFLWAQTGRDAPPEQGATGPGSGSTA